MTLPQFVARAVLACLLLLPAHVFARDACLRINLREADDRFVLRAQVAGDVLEQQTRRTVTAISKEFRSIYLMLEKRQKLDADFDARLNRLSVEMFGTLTDAMNDATCIVFGLRPEQMHFALDLLPLSGRPLFLQKPVAYVLRERTELADLNLGGNARGLLLRDPDTDPDDGAGEAREMYPASKLLLMENARPKVLNQANYDFLLISGHGSVSPPWKEAGDEEDSIGFNDDELTAERLGRGRYKLVYLDSCQLGVSRPFIEAARDAGARYYLAPITSNEAGNSSTRTIRYVFRNLRDGRTPLQALFNARTRLYDDFKDRTSRAKLMYYAFPFRLYAF